MTPVGRPEIGQPINIRLGDALLAKVDGFAETYGISRAEAIRRILASPQIELTQIEREAAEDRISADGIATLKRPARAIVAAVVDAINHERASE
jgi:metal-responsive CopG/Arc/MetJ family transcriptional regulator